MSESLTLPRTDVHPNHLCPRTALSKQGAEGGAVRAQSTRSTDQLQGSSSRSVLLLACLPTIAHSTTGTSPTRRRSPAPTSVTKDPSSKDTVTGSTCKAGGAAQSSLRLGRNQSTSKQEKLPLFSNCCLWLCSFFLPVLLQGHESIF